MNSLQTRLRLGLAFSLMLLMVLLWWMGSFAVRELGEDLIESRLEHDAESLLAAINISDTTHPLVDWSQINPIYKRPFSGHYFVVQFANQQLTSRSLWEQSLPITLRQEKDTNSSWRIQGPSEQELLVISRSYSKQGHKVTLAVAEDISPLEDHLSLFQWTFAGIALSVLFVLLVVQQRVISQSLRQLDDVRSGIQQLEQGIIGTLSEDVPLEILPLVQELNRSLELLAQRIERSRNALGNLAHALKGPLNLLIQLIDSQELANHTELKQQAQIQTQRIHQLMERELKRARLAGTGSPGQRFNPQQELPDLLMVLQQVHQARSLQLNYNVSNDTPAFGDREDMLELLGNLLDNACKWARSTVQCNITGSDPVTITIDDDGPGLNEMELEQLTQRGTRLDESVEGHGLGLAITKDIVKLYGGTLHFMNSPNLGGLRIEVKLFQSGQ